MIWFKSWMKMTKISYLTMTMTCWWKTNLKMSKRPSLDSNQLHNMSRKAQHSLVIKEKTTWQTFLTPSIKELEVTSLSWEVNKLLWQRTSIQIHLNRNNELQATKINSRTNNPLNQQLKPEKLVQLRRWRVWDPNKFLKLRKLQA